MHYPSKDSTRRIEDAKTRLLSAREAPDQALGDKVVGDQVLASWRRSKFWGVSADRLDPPYSDQVEFESRLALAARPVMDRLEGALAGTAMCIILTDARGQVLQRRSGERSIDRHLDTICLAPGFSYAEEFVGTNGIGSAIESRKPFFVSGAEHFARSLTSMSCAGAPILQPLTGRLQGVIDLTCRAVDTNPLMKVLAEEAAADITQRLAEQGSLRERALLQEFLTASHNSSRAVVAVFGDVVISNTMAAGMLDRSDHVLVKERAAELVNRGDSVTEILLASGDTAHLRAHPAGIGSDSGGVVVELTLRRARGPARCTPSGSPSSAPDPAGRSGAWVVTWEKISQSCHNGERLLAVGEQGTGKLAVLTAAHERWHAAGKLEVVDMEQVGFDGVAAIEALAAALIRGPAAVVLRHVDAISDGAWPPVRDWIEQRGDQGTPWIAATLRANDPDTLVARTSPFAVVVPVPALRYRMEDVRDLVPTLLARLAPGREACLSADAMQTLMRYPWPGNVGELEDVLRLALGRRPRGRITPEDLPDAVHGTKRQVLSTWEAMERDLITRTLLECKGDKVAAASRLGISRATIYRKCRTYGIVLST